MTRTTHTHFLPCPTRAAFGFLIIVLALVSNGEAACKASMLNSPTRRLNQADKDSDIYFTPGCTWDFSSKTCRLSIAHHALFYKKVKDKDLQASLFSVQDCTPTTMSEICTEKYRSQCLWTTTMCEPALLSGIELLTKCYGSASNIFLNKCDDNQKVTEAKCTQTDTRPGCVWDNGPNPYQRCFFSVRDFLKDLETLGRDTEDLPRVTFTPDATQSIEAMVDECSATVDLSCNLKQNCLFENKRGCRPNPSAIMKLAKVDRGPDADKICKLVDLLNIGNCSIPTSKQNCDDLGHICSWDGISGRCMPSPTLVFEAAVEEPNLREEFEEAKQACGDLKSRDKCESMMV